MKTRLGLEWMFKHWVQGFKFKCKVEWCMCECIFHYIAMVLFCTSLVYQHHWLLQVLFAAMGKVFVIGFKSPTKCLELEVCNLKIDL
jgi:hypothetical protein